MTVNPLNPTLRSRFRAAATRQRARHRRRRQDADFNDLLTRVPHGLRAELVAAYARQS